MEKRTKIDMYLQILSHLTDEEEIEFINKQIALTEKKNASRSNKPTKNQVMNHELTDKIYEAMEEGVAYRIADIKGLVDELADATPQKVSALVTKLRNEVKVSRELIKGTAWFTKI